ncbi:MAG TPA: hypothetical protein VNO74_06665, partial [Methylomirabilota bacterium]|nr:hypothetical protein [Methylomirabilota bacterium]
NRPINMRFYFSGPYNSWHGSPSMQDSHIPLIVASQSHSGEELKELVDHVAGDKPTELDLTPIVRALLLTPVPQHTVPADSPAATPGNTSATAPASSAGAPPVNPAGASPSATPAATPQ